MDPEKPVDRRIARTKTAIRAALISLIEEKGFDAILVSDISDRANINRGTFYLHYQDKFDLLEQTQTEIIDDIERIVLQVNGLDLSNLGDLDHPLAFIVELFEYLQQNADLMHAIFSVESGLPFQTSIRKTITKNLQLEYIVGMKEKNFLVPSHYLLSYAVSAHLGVIQEWLDRGCVETPREMAIIVSKITWYGVLKSTGFIHP
jgi:AcrR family transcriptional regulator